MKLRVIHLGRISQAELDIRPLTIFVGHNHTGKTWTAYALYGLAQNLASVRYWPHERINLIAPSPELGACLESLADQIVDSIMKNPEARLSTRIVREEVIRGLPSQALAFSSNRGSLAKLLGVNQSEISEKEARVELTLSKEEFNRPIFTDLEISYQPAPPVLHFAFYSPNQAEPSDSHFIPLFGSKAGEPPDNKLRLEIVAWIRTSISYLTWTLLNNAVALPAERKALLSLELPPSGYRVGGELAGDEFPAPVHDFLSMIAAARRLRGRAEGSTSELTELAGVLERRVLEGTVSFGDEGQSQKPNGSPTRRGRSTGIESSALIRYQSDPGVDLPMHATASLVRSLAGLDLYLKVFCRSGDLLVIDEPEMNAHPEAQLKIIEFLAVLVNYGVSVVITTHSPYLVDHLSNLMQASELSESSQEAIAPRFKLGMKQAFVSPDKVSTYLFTERGTVEDILDRRQGIVDIGTFGGPTDYMEGLAHGIWDLKDEDTRVVQERPNVL